MKRYTESHEWIDDKGKVGVTAHALELLGDIVFVELPEDGATLEAGDSIAIIESHKAASDIYAPVLGTVLSSNQTAVDTPEDISPDDDLWLFDIQPDDSDAANQLMDEAAYAKFIENNA